MTPAVYKRELRKLLLDHPDARDLMVRAYQLGLEHGLGARIHLDYDDDQDLRTAVRDAIGVDGTRLGETVKFVRRRDNALGDTAAQIVAELRANATTEAIR